MMKVQNFDWNVVSNEPTDMIQWIWLLSHNQTKLYPALRHPHTCSQTTTTVGLFAVPFKLPLPSLTNLYLLQSFGSERFLAMEEELPGQFCFFILSTSSHTYTFTCVCIHILKANIQCSITNGREDLEINPYYISTLVFTSHYFTMQKYTLIRCLHAWNILQKFQEH